MADPLKKVDSRMVVQLSVEELRAVVREEIKAAAIPKELYTAEELAKKLKVPVSWVYDQSRLGTIPTHRLGRYIRFDFEAVLYSRAYEERKVA